MFIPNWSTWSCEVCMPKFDLKEKLDWFKFVETEVLNYVILLKIL